MLHQLRLDYIHYPAEYYNVMYSFYGREIFRQLSRLSFDYADYTHYTGYDGGEPRTMILASPDRDIWLPNELAFFRKLLLES